jgi:hypothetical protein
MSIPQIKQIDQTTAIRSDTTRDKALERAIRRVYNVEKFKKMGARFNYLYKKIDLNGDKQPEAIVYLNSITTCTGSDGGCDAMIFKNVGQEYKPVSSLKLIQPLIIANNKTNGWHNLITPGENYYLHKFNGERYKYVDKVANNTPITGKSLFCYLEDKLFEL